MAGTHLWRKLLISCGGKWRCSQYPLSPNRPYLFRILTPGMGWRPNLCNTAFGGHLGLLMCLEVHVCDVILLGRLERPAQRVWHSFTAEVTHSLWKSSPGKPSHMTVVCVVEGTLSRSCIESQCSWDRKWRSCWEGLADIGFPCESLRQQWICMWAAGPSASGDSVLSPPSLSSCFLFTFTMDL